MGDYIDGPSTPISGKIIPMTKQEKKIYADRAFEEAAKRGEYPEAIFGTRDGAKLVAVVMGLCLASLAGMVTHIGMKEAEQKRSFEQSNVDTTGWPECKGREAPWRNHCVAPK